MTEEKETNETRQDRLDCIASQLLTLFWCSSRLDLASVVYMRQALSVVMSFASVTCKILFLCRYLTFSS